MDCNREEALRAKQIAEKKMENKDFSAALKVAQKAQQLYPELENISQLILVCEVHLSAEKKSYGSEKDWYSILKIDPSSDDLSIKKQYRKLALVLHPDKNKFSGSTDAFKLIGEAQRVLLDREKRIIHDSKRRAYSAPNWAPKQPPRQQHSWNPVFPQGHSGNFAGDNFTGGRTGNFQFQRAQTGASGVRLTFWTVCPFCSVRYQFYRDDVLNKMIHCQGCKKSFVAYEMNLQGPNPARPPPPPVPQRNSIPVPTPTPVPPKPKPKPKPTEPQNVNRKRKKKVDESSESSDTSSSSESEEEEEEDEVDGNSTESDENAPETVDKKPANQDFEHVGEQPRRSARAKRNVSYTENVNDNDLNDHDHDDEAAPSTKRAPSTGPAKPKPKPKPKPEDTFWKAEVREPVKESQNQESQKDDIVDLESEPEPEEEPESEEEPEVFECPDPEFSDFDKDRKEESFAPGQIWAVYDNEDAMPRFYAYIRKVLLPGFNVQLTWLKPVPETDDETSWVDEELPVCCGNFKRGKHDKAEDLPMFSHLVTWEEGKKGIFNIVPRKGETWALFKDWNINWSNDGTKKYEYEFVEVLSDYDEAVGFRVWYLEKVAGFRCLFGRKEDGELVIPESDKYRFAHLVPSSRMSGEEREDVPKGCYELDPAALPASAFE